jgi:hypothetical protein
MSPFVTKLQRIAREAGGDLLLVSRSEFAGYTVKRGVTRPPGVGGLACSYSARVVFLCRALYRRRYLVVDLVHEMWHVFGSPFRPSKCDDQNDLTAIAWEFALMRQIGASRTMWKCRWARCFNNGGWVNGWPAPPSGRLGDISTVRFLFWANHMMDVGQRQGYTVKTEGETPKTLVLGCVRKDGLPVMLRSDVRPRW